MTHNPTNQFIQIDGIKTRYWDVGQGDIPIVLVHGLIASAEYWEKNIFALAKNHRVIAFDLIGFGQTDKPDIDYPFTTFVHFLKSFLAGLHIRTCFLIGHSLGGSICLKFALDHPDYIKKLVLVSPAGFSRKIPLALRFTNLPLLNKLIYFTPRKLITFFIRHHTYDKKCLSADFFDRVYPFNFSRKSIRTMLRFLHHSINLDDNRKKLIDSTINRFLEMTLPVLIVWGKKDTLITFKNAYTVIEQKLNVKWHIFDRCGHIPQIERADKFNQIVTHFLKIT